MENSALHKYVTPCYLYNVQLITQSVEKYKTSLATVGNFLMCYAVKANSNARILRHISSLGCGADCVSIGEVRLALDGGFPSRHIIFSGVGKQQFEILEAIALGIKQINVESVEELDEIQELVAELGLDNNVQMAIRVNTDTDAETHEYLSTGRHRDKFGVSIASSKTICSNWARDYPNLSFGGLTIHLGSMISSIHVFREGFEKLASLVQFISTNTHLRFSTLDFGGGASISYSGEDGEALDIGALTQLMGEIRARVAPSATLLLEPGRSVVGAAGLLLTSVVRVKARVGAVPLAVVDAGMNDLIRPALYGARHRLQLLGEPEGLCQWSCDVVGPVCESADVFGGGLSFPRPLRRGDRLAIRDVGAYGSSMASTYNARPKAPEILLESDEELAIFTWKS